jgi:hypothetical protein
MRQEPAHIVHSRAGNSMEVAEDRYLMVTPEDVLRATGMPSSILNPDPTPSALMFAHQESSPENDTAVSPHLRTIRPLEYPHGESETKGLTREKRKTEKRRLQIRLYNCRRDRLNRALRHQAPEPSRRTGSSGTSQVCPLRSSLPCGLSSVAEMEISLLRRANSALSLPYPSPPLEPRLARLPPALLRRLALHGHHQRPSQAAEGPRCRQGVSIHPEPPSRETGLQRAPEVQIGGSETGGGHQEAAPGRKRQIRGGKVTGRGYFYLYPGLQPRPLLPMPSSISLLVAYPKDNEVAKNLTGWDSVRWSAISTFGTCPLKYKFRYIGGLMRGERPGLKHTSAAFLGVRPLASNAEPRRRESRAPLPTSRK